MNDSVAQFLIDSRDPIGFFYIPGASQTDGLLKEVVELTNAHWKQFPPQSQFVQITLYSCYSVFSIISIVANFLCLVLLVKKYEKFDLLLLNLTVSDLSSTLIRYPLLLMNLANTTTKNCVIYGATTEACSLASLLTIVAFGYERYSLAIKKAKLSKLKIFLLILIIWGYSITISLIPVLSTWTKYSPDALLTTCSFDYFNNTIPPKYFTLAILGTYAAALTIFVSFYCVITFTLIFSKKHEINLEDDKLIMFSYFLWLIFSTPYLIIKGQEYLGGNQYITPVLTFVAITLTIIPPSVIPILNMKFSKTFLE